uniref:Circularly permuted ATP-grasp type 2 domain-containing protein n=2 Tax=Lotharella globosa TaxID=91324 RepID=A0A7S3Z3V6_9EUKA
MIEVMRMCFQKHRQSFKEKRVGMVIVDAEVYDVDPTNSTVKGKSIIEEAKYWQTSLKERHDKIMESLNKPMNEWKAKRKAKDLDRVRRLLTVLNTLLTRFQDTRQPKDLCHIRKFLRKNMKEDFKDLLRQGVPGLLDAYFNGVIKMINGPGFEFLGDKHFCLYIDRLVTAYLKEEPILKTIPTLSFAEHDLQELLAAVFDNPDAQNYTVVKRVDGRGGGFAFSQAMPITPPQEINELKRRESHYIVTPSKEETQCGWVLCCQGRNSRKCVH